jgi:PiT family inorganic phosphate transporter
VLIPFEEIKKPRFDSHFWSIVTEPHNIKWFLVGFIFFSLAIFNLFFSSFSTAKSEAVLKKMQLLSSAAFSLGHGGNDSQKVMGIIAAAVAVYIRMNPNVDLSIGWLDLNVVLPDEDKGITANMPTWIPLTCYSVIALGTLSGGWKIVKTMGSKITKVNAFEGVVAESAGALTLFMTEHFKIPVSTTHTITGSIIGVGVTKRVSAVRWGVTVRLIWAWILTIPVSALLAALVYSLLNLFL